MGGGLVTVLLDTHALLWFASVSDKFSSAAREAVTDADLIYVSAISAWEIGMLVQKERLSLSYDVGEWIDLTKTIPKVQWVNITPEIGIQSTRLPGQFHGDPADRLITATAILLGSTIITADQKIQSYKHVRSIW
jgi:PIN domain nuclease of toxin-antitoxin system